MIHMMIGIQGAGKSTFANEYAKEINAEIISTDGVRIANPGISEDLVWPYVYKKVAECVTNNIEVIFDATSITPKVRKRFIDNVELHGVKCVIGAYFFDVDKNVCAARVEKRNNENTQINIPIEAFSTILPLLNDLLPIKREHINPKDINKKNNPVPLVIPNCSLP